MCNDATKVGLFLLVTKLLVHFSICAQQTGRDSLVRFREIPTILFSSFT